MQIECLVDKYESVYFGNKLHNFQVKNLAGY